MNEVTVIIVSHNTEDLLRNCINSIRKFHGDVKILVIDGSNKNSTCYEFASRLKSKHTTPVNVGFNIGHGRGIKLGASTIKTKYFLTMDSDATLLSGEIIPLMITLLKSNMCYGVGEVVNVDANGVNCAAKGIPYLHPYFSLIKKSLYDLYPPPINHGAPMIRTMTEIFSKQIHSLQPIRLEAFVHHHGRGTRRLSPKEFKPKNWDSI